MPVQWPVSCAHSERQPEFCECKRMRKYRWQWDTHHQSRVWTVLPSSRHIGIMCADERGWSAKSTQSSAYMSETCVSLKSYPAYAALLFVYAYENGRDELVENVDVLNVCAISDSGFCVGLTYLMLYAFSSNKCRLIVYCIFCLVYCGLYINTFVDNEALYFKRMPLWPMYIQLNAPYANICCLAHVCSNAILCFTRLPLPTGILAKDVAITFSLSGKCNIMLLHSGRASVVRGSNSSRRRGKMEYGQIVISFCEKYTEILT